MAELCKSCVHQKVCMKDKNLVGDVFVLGNPMIFDNAKLFAQYEERKKAGFPCDTYLSADVAPVRHGRWEWAEGHEGITCSVCGKRCNGPRIEWKYRYNVPFPAYCENCGARMEGEP